MQVGIIGVSGQKCAISGFGFVVLSGSGVEIGEIALEPKK